MQNLTNQKYFYYIAFMLMLTTFLPIVTYKLPVYIGSHFLWTIIWGVSLLFLKPQVFIQKLMLSVIVYGLFLLIMIYLFWTDMDAWNVKALWVEYYQIVVGCSMITYFHLSKDYLSLAKLVKWVMIFIFISSIITIFYYTQIEKTTERIRWDEWNEGAKRFGYATYGMAIAMMSIVGVLMYMYKNKILNFKYIWIFVLFLIVITIFRIQLVANIILTAFLLVLSIVSVENRKTTLIILSIIGIIFLLIPQSTYINLLQRLSVVFANFHEISYKLNDMALYLEFGEYIDENAVAGRMGRYTMLLNTFQEHPIMGCYFMQISPSYLGETVHLHWMNKIVVTGIIGFIFFISIIIRFIKDQTKYLKGNYQYYFIISILTILIYGFFKTIAGRECWYMFFVILPGIYYFPLLNNKSNMIEEEKENEIK